MTFLISLALVFAFVALIFALLASAYLGHMSLRIQSLEKRLAEYENTPVETEEMIEVTTAMSEDIANDFMKRFRKSQNRMN
jgi:hypothetical protein